MAFMPRRKSLPATKLSTYNNLGIGRTRASIGGSDKEFASHRVLRPDRLSNMSSNPSSLSTLFYDTGIDWESDIIPFSEWDEEESTGLMEEMKNENTLTQQTSEKLTIWGVLRTKASQNFKLKAESLYLFGRNFFGRESKKDARNFDNLHISGGYLDLSEEPDDNTEIEDYSNTHQANISVRRSETTAQTHVQAEPWPALERSGAIRGRKPRVGLRTTNNFHESRMVRTYLNSSELRMSSNNGEASGSAGTLYPTTTSTTKTPCFRNQCGCLFLRAPKQVHFAPAVEIVPACAACEHRTQSKPCSAPYNYNKALDSASTSESEDLAWTKAASGIRFLSTAKARRLLERESHALRTMRPFLKRDMVCFAWGQCADPQRLGWLDGAVVGEVRAGVDVDWNWLSRN
jgi:hypothetical protein